MGSPVPGGARRSTASGAKQDFDPTGIGFEHKLPRRGAAGGLSLFRHDAQLFKAERLAPGVYEVEFSDDEGRTYASVSLRADQLLQLQHEPSRQAA